MPFSLSLIDRSEITFRALEIISPRLSSTMMQPLDWSPLSPLIVIFLHRASLPSSPFSPFVILSSVGRLGFSLTTTTKFYVRFWALEWFVMSLALTLPQMGLYLFRKTNNVWSIIFNIYKLYNKWTKILYKNKYNSFIF